MVNDNCLLLTIVGTSDLYREYTLGKHLSISTSFLYMENPLGKNLRDDIIITHDCSRDPNNTGNLGGEDQAGSTHCSGVGLSEKDRQERTEKLFCSINLSSSYPVMRTFSSETE